MDARSQSGVVLLTVFAVLSVSAVSSTLVVNELQNALGEAVDLALAVLKHAVLVKLVVRARLAGVLRRGCRLGQLSNGRDEDGRVANVVGELSVLSLEKLNNGLSGQLLQQFMNNKTHPDSNVLECSVGAAKEADKVGVQATVWLIPHSVEGGVVLSRFAGKIAESSGTVTLHLDAGRVGEGNKNFADSHLEKLGLEVV